MTADPVGAGDAAEIRGAPAVRPRGAGSPAAAGLPVALGGLVEPGRRQVRVSEPSGTATPALSALAVVPGSGPGGEAAAPARPCAVTGCSASRRISHGYDAPVAAEGLRASSPYRWSYGDGCGPCSTARTVVAARRAGWLPRVCGVFP